MVINIFSAIPLPVSRKYIRTIIRKALKVRRSKAGELSVFFCDDETIKRYNRTFLKSRRATDVIAFYDDKRSPGYQKKYLGDIVVSVERAKDQAEAIGHSLKKELTVLIIHGILHLFGYRDTRPALKKKMFKKQEEILKSSIN